MRFLLNPVGILPNSDSILVLECAVAFRAIFNLFTTRLKPYHVIICVEMEEGVVESGYRLLTCLINAQLLCSALVCFTDTHQYANFTRSCTYCIQYTLLQVNAAVICDHRLWVVAGSPLKLSVGVCLFYGRATQVQNSALRLLTEKKNRLTPFWKLWSVFNLSHTMSPPPVWLLQHHCCSRSLALSQLNIPLWPDGG